MLKGISPVLSPDLLKALAEMGHSDRLVIADGNFPAESIGKNSIVIRADGHGVPEILDAVLALLPLDSYVENPVSLMAVMEGDTCGTPSIWNTYKDILKSMSLCTAVLKWLNALLFMNRQRMLILLLQQGKQLFTQILCFKRVLLYE